MANDCIIKLTINADEAIKNITTVENELKNLVAQAKEAREALSGIQVGESSTADLSQLETALNGLTASVRSGFDTVSESMGHLVHNQAAIGEGTITYLTAINEQLSNIPVEDVEELAEATEEAAEATENLAENAEDASDSGSSFGDWAKNLISTAAILAVVTKMISTVANLTREGFENMAEYSEEYKNATNDLKNSMQTLKLQLAGAFEPIVTTIIPYITKLVDWLTIAADKVAQFIAIISGKSTYAKAIKQTKDYTEAVKAASNALASFDELNVLTQDSGNGSNDNGPWWEETAIDSNLLNAVDEFGKKMKEAMKPFVDGFNSSFKVDFTELKDNVDRIGKSVINIFADPRVQASVKQYSDLVSFNLGRIIGDGATIGVNISTGITGGIANYLDNGGTEEIKKHIIKMYKTASKASTVTAEITNAAATISEAFSSEAGEKFVENLTGVLVESHDQLVETASELGVDMYEALSRPFVENAPEFEESVDGMLSSSNNVLEGLRDLITEVGDAWDKTYTKKIEPFIDGVGEGLSNMFNKISTTWNEVGQPVIDNITKAFGNLVSDELKEFLKSIIDLFGQLMPILYAVWQVLTWLIGTITQIIENLLPVIGPLIEGIIGVLGGVFNILAGIFEWLAGAIESFVGLLTGDYEMIMEGTYKFVDGFWHVIAGIANAVLSVYYAVCNAIIGVANFLTKGINKLLTAMNLEPLELLTPWDDETKYKVPTSLSAMGIDHLANGGVTTGATIAEIGEAGREAVLPLERDTGWADIVADKLAERMGGGNYTFVAELDGRTLFNETVKQNQIYQKSTGRSAFGF